jgi:hypothetical protein
MIWIIYLKDTLNNADYILNLQIIFQSVII